MEFFVGGGVLVSEVDQVLGFGLKLGQGLMQLIRIDFIVVCLLLLDDAFDLHFLNLLLLLPFFYLVQLVHN